MYVISKASAKIFNRLLDNELQDKDFVIIDNTKGAYMPLHIARLDKNTISLAHYGELNGDLMADPEVLFDISDRNAIKPTYFRNDYVGVVRDSCDSNFCDIWLKNIQYQQNI